MKHPIESQTSFFIFGSLFYKKGFPNSCSRPPPFENTSLRQAKRRSNCRRFSNISGAIFFGSLHLVESSPPSFAPTGWPTGSLLQAFPFSMIGFDRSKKSHLLLFYAYYMQVHKRMFWQKVFNACASYRIPFCDVVLFDKS